MYRKPLALSLRAASGAEDAQQFTAIADELFGADWADSRHYRFGASSLLASLLKALGHGDGKERQQLLRRNGDKTVARRRLRRQRFHVATLGRATGS